MIDKKKLRRFILTSIIFLLVVSGGTFYWYRVSRVEKLPDRAARVLFPFGGQGARMIPLIEACQKVKELEHFYYLAQSPASLHVKTQTIYDLIAALNHERRKIERQLDRMRQGADVSMANRKKRSLMYYLSVLKENIQDLDDIIYQRKKVSQNG